MYILVIATVQHLNGPNIDTVVTYYLVPEHTELYCKMTPENAGRYHNTLLEHTGDCCKTIPENTNVYHSQHPSIIVITTIYNLNIHVIGTRCS